ncbi:MAG: hypothetical protein GDA44_01935 [Prochloron sp. SP5CPC1]|nr:hypothetical protein [Candidatus Paraprochloron terpiosi SP5CPC1]
MLEIKIWDFGEPFDLATNVESLRHNQEFPLQRDKQWSWKLMDQITDELRYFRVKEYGSIEKINDGGKNGFHFL